MRRHKWLPAALFLLLWALPGTAHGVNARSEADSGEASQHAIEKRQTTYRAAEVWWVL